MHLTSESPRRTDPERSDLAPSQTSRGRLCGFTLIELLAVMVVVGILTTIVIPIIGRAGDSANTAKCGVNMRNIWVAMELFAQGSQGMYPKANYYMDTNRRDFIGALGYDGYLDDHKRVGLCPADPANDRLSNLAPIKDGPRSYFLIVPAMVPSGNADKTRQRDDIINPARTGMMIELHNGFSNVGAVGIRSHENRGANFGVGDDIVGVSKAVRSVGHRNGNRNILFCDGHIEFLSPAQILGDRSLWGRDID